MGHEVVLHQQGVHLPKASADKSIVRKYADMVLGGLPTKSIVAMEHAVGIDYVSAGFDTLEKWGIGGATGGLLSLADKMLGGLDTDNGPVDLLSSGALGLLGTFGARTRFGSIARTASGGAMAVFTKRKMDEMLAGRKSISFGSDDTGEDPILAAAEALR